MTVADEIDALRERGRQIYIDLCASCHGIQGQGEKSHHDGPLVGELVLGQLIELISDTMPEDEPDACVGADAEAVAKYVFEEFYSAEAQYKRNAPRIQLSRRTVRQYRESVADLIGSFGDQLWIPEERGIAAEYFASSNWNQKRKLASQVDPNLEFGNGVLHFRADGKYEGVEEIKKVNKMGDGFSVFWNGGIIAPESGKYEFIVHCRNGFKLWVNDTERPLVDRWVRSNNELTHTETAHLLAGRVYSFKLHLFQYQDPEVTIQVEWKLPSGRQTVIPADAFIPHGVREGIVISTPFPPDDASSGYKRGVSVSKQWDESTTVAAIETANWVSERVWKLAKTNETDDYRVEKIRDFCVSFVERAFVSPLSDDEKNLFVWQHFKNNLSIHDQVKRVVILALKSPRFLYPAVQKRAENYELAARMALVFLDSVPDQLLFDLAANGRLSNTDEFSSQMNRLLNDNRSKQKLLEFFHDWLKTESAIDAKKDTQAFPKFNEQIVHDLSQSFDLYLNEVVWSEASDFLELFLADYLYVNPQIASYYGLEIDEENEPLLNGFTRVNVEPGQRAGILTHPLLMAGLAYHKDSSPIHRGVFVARNLLGRRLLQPPENVAPLSDEFDPGMTTRERVEHQTKATACMNCHSVINPLGFSLENFDAVGRFRTQEKQKPIDVSSVYTSSTGNSVELTGARDLANYLANNETAQQSFIRQVFRYYAKQPIEAYGKNCLEELHMKFIGGNFNIKRLINDIARVIVKHGYE